MITLDGDKKEKKPPVKGGPTEDGDGGLFTAKIILIMDELKKKFKEWRKKWKERNGKVSG